MAFSQVIDADTKSGTVTTNSTSWTLTYPTNLANGDLILALVASDGNHNTSTWPSGWVHLENSNGTIVSLIMAKKLSDGTETGNFTLTLPNSEQGAWRIFRITGWEGTIGTTFSVDEIAVVGNANVIAGASSTPDPTNLDPTNSAWDNARDTLWFAVAAVDTSRTFSAFPTNYTNTSSDVSGGSTGASLGVARRELNATSEDPGTFTISASDDWVTKTIAIAPAGIKAGYANAQLTIIPTRIFGQAQLRISALVTSDTASTAGTNTSITLNNLQENDVIIASAVYSSIMTITADFSPSRSGASTQYSGTGILLRRRYWVGVPAGVTSAVISFSVDVGPIRAHAAAFRAGGGKIYIEDNIGVNSSSTGTNPSIGSPTVNQGQDLFYGAVAELTATSATAGSGYILISGTNDGTRSISTEYYDAIIASQAVTFTNGTSAAWVGVADSFTKATVTKVYAQASIQIILKQTGFSQAALLIAGTYFLPFTDTFTRSVTDGLGTSNNGDAWTLLQGTTANFDVDGTQGTGITTSTDQFWRLPKTLIIPSINGGLDFKAVISINKSPASGTIRFKFGLESEHPISVTSFIGVRVTLNTSGISADAYHTGTSIGSDTSAYTAGDSYNIEAQIIPASNGFFARGKSWKVGNVEIAWTEGSFVASKSWVSQPIRFIVETDGGDANAPFTWTFDNFSIQEAWITRFAQAQLKIATTRNYAQSMLRVGRTTYEYHLRKISGLQSFWTLGEPSTATAISDYFGAISGTVNGTPTFSQDSTNPLQLEDGIKFNSSSDYLTFGDNYDFPNSTNSYTFLIWFKHTGALTATTERLISKESASNVGMRLTVSNISVAVVRDGLGAGNNSNINTSGDVWEFIGALSDGTTPFVHLDDSKGGAGLVRSATDTATNLTIGRNGYDSSNNFSGTIGSIAVFNTGISFDDFQALYTIAKSGAIVRPGQAQFRTKQIYKVYAQAQLKVQAGVTTTNAFAQAQLNTLATTTTYAQSQADILTTSRVFSQAQADIKQVTNAYSQAQLDVKTTVNAFAQAQLDTKETTSQFAQTQADIKAINNSFAQAQLDILTTYKVFAQAQISVVKTSTVYSQAQLDTKAIATSFAQAQLDTKAIIATYAQANINILTTYKIFAQAQLTIIAWRFAQAQADIEQTYQGYAQSQLDIKATTNQFSQAQIDINASYTTYAQANIDIKQVSMGYAQAQINIKSTTNTFAQSQFDIKSITNTFAQAQLDIKATTNNFAQSNIDIKTTYTTYAQAQMSLIVVSRGYAQAQIQVYLSKDLRPIQDITTNNIVGVVV